MMDPWVGTMARPRVFNWTGSFWNQIGDDIDGKFPFDHSGASISLSENGEIIAIGAPYSDILSEWGIGEARVFRWNGNFWEKVGDDIHGENDHDWSAASVSLSSDGRRVAIGAPGNNDGGMNSGHVRVFQWDASWEQVGNDIDGEAAQDYSGWTVSLSSDGTKVAVLAPFNDGNGAASGHVRVYEFIPA